MPRPRRHLSNAGVYHIIIRGVNKQNIFIDDKDKIMFIRLLSHYKEKSNCKIYAYCLMDNHVHILFEDKEFLISDFMRNITSLYAFEFNRRHKRVGHLFQDRFKSIVVYNDGYLLRLIRYIHRNPEKAGICKAREYKWSSYNEYIYKPQIIERDVILLKFDLKKDLAIKKFKEFVSNDKYDNLDRIYASEKVNDEDIEILIKDILNERDFLAIKKYTLDEKMKIIEKIPNYLTIKDSQIARVLGISKNFRARMKEKGKKGSDPFFPEKI